MFINLKINLPLPLRFAVLSTLDDSIPSMDLVGYVAGELMTLDVTVNRNPTPPTMPCPSNPDGDPGDGGELEFDIYVGDDMMDAAKLSRWAYAEIEEIVIKILGE